MQPHPSTKPLKMARTTATATLPLLSLIVSIVLYMVAGIDTGTAESSSVSSSSFAASTQRSPYHSAQTALSESLTRIASTNSFLKNLQNKFKKSKKSPEYQAIGQCLEVLDSSHQSITKSIRELKTYMAPGCGKTPSQEQFWDHMDNVKTWISGALTEQDTCLDGFVDLALNGTAIEASIKPRIAYNEQSVNSALAFVTQFGDDYSASTDFITASCAATCYPLLCLESLLATGSIALQQSPHQLARSALAVSLAGAESAKASLKKMTKYDCLDYIDDGVDQLSQAIQELDQMGKNTRKGKKDFICRASNLQTVVSAAIIDGNKCIDELKIKSLEEFSTILRQVTNVVQMTRNGLALVNQFVIKN